MKLSKSQLFNIIIFFVGSGIIASIIHRIGWQQTKFHILEMGPAFLWLFPIYLITLLGDTFSWRLLIRKPVSMVRVMLVANSGTAINALTPSGDGGEFVKGNLIKSDIGGPESVSSLLLWNFLYSITKKILLILGPILYLIFGPFETDPSIISTRVAVGFLIAGILTSIHLPIIFFLVKYYGVEKSAAFFHKLPLVRRLDSEKFLSFARKVEDSFEDFSTKYKARFLLSGLLLLISHISVCLEIWYVLKMLGMNISPITSIFLFAGSALLQTIVSFSPIEMGVTEAGSMGLYKIIGFQPILGFMQEFIRRLRRLVFNFLGLLYLGYCAFREEKAYKNKPEPSPNQSEPSPNQSDPSPQQSDPSPQQSDPSPQQSEESPNQSKE
jgi:uncharacterized protein (TIRG00374 family)